MNVNWIIAGFLILTHFAVAWTSGSIHLAAIFLHALSVGLAAGYILICCSDWPEWPDSRRL